MAIIIGGGYHTQPRYPAEVSRMSEDELVEQFLRDSVPARWGVMGEIGIFRSNHPRRTESEPRPPEECRR